LPVKLQLISNSQVSATLGKTALNQGLVAGLVGFAIVCLFLLLFYRVLGAIAIGGLLIYGIYFFALIKLIPITLNAAGDRRADPHDRGSPRTRTSSSSSASKEEIRGRQIDHLPASPRATSAGLKRSSDANVVTFMTAFILFALATAEVKGFAFVLGIGTVVSLFTAVLATQAALGADGALETSCRNPAALGAAAARRRLEVRLHGRVEVVLLAVGHDSS